MYFSSIFPYVVLVCFLIRGLMLDGAAEGIAHMFYPKVTPGPARPEVSPGRPLTCRRVLAAVDLGGHPGVAPGGHAGVLRSGPGLRLHHRLLLLQPQEQQLPPRRLHRLLHQLPDLAARHAGGVRRARLPRQGKGHDLREEVGSEGRGRLGGSSILVSLFFFLCFVLFYFLHSKVFFLLIFLHFLFFILYLLLFVSIFFFVFIFLSFSPYLHFLFSFYFLFSLYFSPPYSLHLICSLFLFCVSFLFSCLYLFFKLFFSPHFLHFVEISSIDSLFNSVSYFLVMSSGFSLSLVCFLQEPAAAAVAASCRPADL